VAPAGVPCTTTGVDSSTRRGFLQAGAAAAAAAAIGPRSSFAQRPDAPNVILVIIDSLRADAIYERGIRTPNIDELMRQGLRFTDVFPEAMPTVPARNSILSGRRVFPFRGWHDYPGLLASPGWAPLKAVDRSLLALLRRAGWWTAYATDNPFLGFAVPYGPLRRSVHRFARTGGQIGGKQRISSVPNDVLRHWLHPSIYPEKLERVGLYLANSRYWNDETRSFAARVTNDAVRLLEEGARRRPFALVLDTFEVHEPWTPPPRYADMYGRWRGPEPAMPQYGRARSWLGPGERGPVLRRLKELYAAEVTLTDRWLGVLFDRLHDLDLERETVIVLVADHGLLLGEHGWTGKISTALHPALTRVPLIVVDPRRRRAGDASSWRASTHDVAPTILSLLGRPVPEAMEGADLSRAFRGQKLPERPYSFGGYGNSFYIRSDRWALWARTNGTGFQLYDKRRDPGETANVAARHPGVVRHLAGVVRRRSGGRLPYYRGVDFD
jgi:arylsulfatase A-like enzyme